MARLASWMVWAAAGACAADPGSLKQIDTTNVARIKVAWTYRTGDKLDRPRTQIQCTPLVVDGIMYATSPQLKVIALDAATGQLKWVHDPFEGADDDRPRGVSRGVAYWSSGKDRRILFTVRHRLVALDASSGQRVTNFGSKGEVDLTQGLGRDISGLAYYVTSPGVVYRDLLILGSTTGEGPRPAAPGHVRAFDIRTGRQQWIFRTIPHPGEHGYDTWPKDAWKTAGGTNVWAGLSVDARRGWVFLATGSPTFDFWGGDRVGDNLFGNAVVALDANTGKRIWHFQAVHHDTWDYDLPAAPSLVTVRRRNRDVDAVAQVTKMGYLFLLDRVTGKPLFPLEERPVPSSDVPGEVMSRTQPVPLKPPPFARQSLQEDDLTDLTPAKRVFVLERYRKLRSGAMYTPNSTQGTLIFPGLNGGANWGGASFDPTSGLLFINSNESISWITLVKAPDGATYTWDHKGYAQLFDDEGYPAMKPPWGNLTAIDLNTGQFPLAQCFRRTSGTHRTWASRHRYHQLWRLDSHCRRTSVHRRHAGPEVSRLRVADRKAAVGDTARNWCLRDAMHVLGEGQAIRSGGSRRRPVQEPRGRLLHCVCPSLIPCGQRIKPLESRT